MDEFIYLFFLQMGLVFVTALDYIVHNWLYNYGLKFSYDWANPYWYILTAIFWIFAAIGVSAYYVDRHRPNKLKALAIFATILGEYHGGFLDTLWFIFSRLAHHQLNWTMNWWWHPFSSWFGHWDLRMNVTLNVIVGILLIGMWAYILKRRD